MLARSFFIGTSSNLLVTRTGIKSWTSSNSARIESVTFKLDALSNMLNISKTSLGQILYVASVGWGKGCIRFWSRLDLNHGCHGNQKLPSIYNGKKMVSPPFLSHFLSDLRKTGRYPRRVKSQSSSSSRIGSFSVVHPWALEKFLIGYNGKMRYPC